MSSTRSKGLRVAAEELLDRTFTDLDPATRTDLATSLVRQWLTCGDRAVLLTLDGQFWLRLERLETGDFLVYRSTQDGTLVDRLRRRGVREKDIATVLHDLTLRQTARCKDDDDDPLLIRVEPATGRFSITRLAPGEE